MVYSPAHAHANQDLIGRVGVLRWVRGPCVGADPSGWDKIRPDEPVSFGRARTILARIPGNVMKCAIYGNRCDESSPRTEYNLSETPTHLLKST